MREYHRYPDTDLATLSLPSVEDVSYRLASLIGKPERMIFSVAQAEEYKIPGVFLDLTSLLEKLTSVERNAFLNYPNSEFLGARPIDLILDGDLQSVYNELVNKL